MRSLRNDHPDAVHHLTCRVNWQVFHLDQTDHAAIYFDEVAAALLQFDIALLGFALMSNHHHLAFRVPAKGAYRELTSRRTACRHRLAYPAGHLKSTVVAQFGHRIHRVVARKLQLKLDITGHFWDRRYFAREIHTAADLAAVIAYEHRNPVRPGIVVKPGDYPWSSAAAYASDSGASPLPLAPEDRLPFGLTWATLRERVLEYQASRAIDDVYRTLAKAGLAPTSPLYDRALVDMLRQRGLTA